MDIEKKIAQFLANAESKPARSKLEPYDTLIRTLHQKRWTYKAIAEALSVEFGLTINPKTIWDYLKIHQATTKTPEHQNSALPNKLPQETPRRRFNLDA